LRYGNMAASVTESDMIARYAAQYVQERAQALERATDQAKDQATYQAGNSAAALSDCVAYPGTVPEIWIVVSCSNGDARFEYHLNRIGGLVHRGLPFSGQQSDKSLGQSFGQTLRQTLGQSNKIEGPQT
jgi:hypothetical protein